MSKVSETSNIETTVTVPVPVAVAEISNGRAHNFEEQLQRPTVELVTSFSLKRNHFFASR